MKVKRDYFGNLPSQDDTKVTISVADELSKFVKLKEQRSYNRRRIFADEEEFNGRNERPLNSYNGIDCSFP